MGIDQLTQDPIRSFEPIKKTESEKKEESRLTMENVGRVFDQASRSANYDDIPVWANNLISHECFFKTNLDLLTPRIAQLFVQLQPRFFKGNGNDYKDAVYSELQQQWDTTKNEKGDNLGIYALKLLALASATGLGKVTTSRAELTYKPKTPILFLGDKVKCDEIINAQKDLEDQNKLL